MTIAAWTAAQQISSTTSGSTSSATVQSPPQALRRAPLFAGLPEEVLAEVGATVRRETYARRATLRDIDAPDALFLVGRGALRLARTDHVTAREITLLLLGEGAFFWFGASAAEGVPHATAVALRAGTEVYRLSYARVFAVLEGYPARLRYALEEMARRTAAAYDRLVDLALYPVATRLVRALVHLVDVTGSLELEITLDELAHWVGAHRGEISGHLAQLGALGLVERTSRRYGRLRVLDLAGLAALQHLSEDGA